MTVTTIFPLPPAAYPSSIIGPSARSNVVVVLGRHPTADAYHHGRRARRKGKSGPTLSSTQINLT